MRHLTLIVFGAIAIIVAVFLHYTLPRQHVVYITGIETKRMETAGSWFYASSERTTIDGTRDVNLIRAIQADGDPMVFRNEDTGWGWPPYFKLDSESLQAEASGMTSNRDTPNWVVVKSYGWRSEWFSIFPNAVKITDIATPADKPWPWTNMVVIALLIALAAWIWRALSRFWDRRIDPMIDRVADVFDGDDDPVATAPAAPKRKKGWFSW